MTRKTLKICLASQLLTLGSLNPYTMAETYQSRPSTITSVLDELVSEGVAKRENRGQEYTDKGFRPSIEYVAVAPQGVGRPLMTKDLYDLAYNDGSLGAQWGDDYE